MTRGNPRPGQQQMPDKSDLVERLAQKAKASTTQAAGEIRDAADDVLAAAREEARKASKASATPRKRGPAKAAG